MQGKREIPYTPFHFGPGLLAKACVPRWFWLTSFVVANVCIDTEVLFYSWQHQSPIHRHFHTYLGGMGLGVGTGLIVYAASRLLHRLVPSCVPWLRAPNYTSRAGVCFQSVFAGIIGGVSHVVLDSLVHHDVQPFWPIAAGNCLAGIVGHENVYVACAALGFLGAVYWFVLTTRRITDRPFYVLACSLALISGMISAFSRFYATQAATAAASQSTSGRAPLRLMNHLLAHHSDLLAVVAALVFTLALGLWVCSFRRGERGTPSIPLLLLLIAGAVQLVLV